MKQTQEPRASIVIPTRNRRNVLRENIKSCYAQSVSVEILVVDDGSTDGTDKMIAAEFGDVRYIRLPGSSGPCRARNRGIESASCEICFPVDDDVVFPSPYTVEQTLVDFSDNRVWAVAIPFVNVNKDGGLMQSLSPSQIASGKEYITYAFVGCSHALRRSVFLQMGGYREQMFYMGEESDICIRALNCGHYVKMGTADACHHLESPMRARPLAAYYGRRNEILMAFWYAPGGMFLPAMANRFLAAVKSCVLSPGGSRIAHIQGTLRGIADCWREGVSSRRPVHRDIYRQFRRLRATTTDVIPVRL